MTHDDPSDVGTRGINPVKFDSSGLWRKDPTWVREDKSMWPANQRSSATEDSEKEKVKKFATLQIKEGVTFDLEKVIEINRYGTEMKLYKVTALVKRFVDNVKKSMKKEVREVGEVTVDEINEARKMWIRRAQHDIQVNTFLSRQLGVDEDADGVFHCYGRLENSELSDDAEKLILATS